jgi:cyclic pyranopterin phosphate synthase
MIGRMATLSHLDAAGRARMVDVTEKAETAREAIARGEVVMRPETAALIQRGGVPKGDVLATARLAGIMGAKRTPDVIPLCHSLALTGAEVTFEWDDIRSRLLIEASARTVGKTGVEMEALTAVAVAALTVYDMCKAVDRGMRIEAIRLVRKSGGRSGSFEAD